MEIPMQKDLKGKKGNSLESAIIIEAQDTIGGVTEEHTFLDQLFSTLDIGIRSVEQTLIIEGQKQYDQFVITMDDGTKKIIFFDISSFW